MFTGLVEGVGEIVGLTPMAEGLRLAVKTSFPAAELTLGESVAVGGACLTVVALDAAPGRLRGVAGDPGLHDFPLEKGGGPGELRKGLENRGPPGRPSGHRPRGRRRGGAGTQARPGPYPDEIRAAGRPEPFRHREGFHRGGRGLSDRKRLHGKHLYGERHSAHRPGNHPGELSKRATGSTWRRISSASTWPGCWGQDGPRGGGSPRSCWPGTGFCSRSVSSRLDTVSQSKHPRSWRCLRAHKGHRAENALLRLEQGPHGGQDAGATNNRKPKTENRIFKHVGFTH